MSSGCRVLIDFHWTFHSCFSQLKGEEKKMIFNSLWQTQKKKKNIWLSFLVRKAKMHKICAEKHKMELSTEIFMPNLSPNNIIFCVLTGTVTVSTVTCYLADRLIAFLSLKSAPLPLKSRRKSPQLQVFSYSNLFSWIILN